MVCPCREEYFINGIVWSCQYTVTTKSPNFWWVLSLFTFSIPQLHATVPRFSLITFPSSSSDPCEVWFFQFVGIHLCFFLHILLRLLPWSTTQFRTVIWEHSQTLMNLSGDLQDLNYPFMNVKTHLPFHCVESVSRSVVPNSLWPRGR